MFFALWYPAPLYSEGAGGISSAKSESAVSDKPDEDSDQPEPRKLPDLGPGEWEPLFELGEDIYPSVVISTATLKGGLWDDNDKEHLGDPWGVIGIVVRPAGDGSPIEVEISGGNFIRSSTFTGTLHDKDKIYCVYPNLKYDYEKLLAVRQTVPEMISFKVRIGDKTYPEKTVKVQVRPVNECVFYFDDSSGTGNDVSYFFAAYVNENHPLIDQIMKEAIGYEMVDSFSGYQGDKEDVMSEMEAIWETLQRRGIHYSSIASSAADDNPYVSTQSVRMVGDSINYAQSNCADGSVLLASIFRRIGLNTRLVILPDHMMVAVDLDENGKETVYIETTMISYSTLGEAIKEGYDQYSENKDRFDSEKEGDEDYHIADIQNARSIGIMPIKDSSAK